MYEVSEVFVPGGFPEVTYVPRDELQLEERLHDYLEERFKVLSLSGPTKVGKDGTREARCAECRVGFG